MPERPGERISVVGVTDPLSPLAVKAITGSSLLVGSTGHLDTVAKHTTPGTRRLILGSEGAALTPTLDVIDRFVGPVCVLASGDPGFFGIVRVLSERVGRERLDVYPAVSSVSLAFARLGLPWDDALVVSAHGRALGAAVSSIGPEVRKVAVLTGPDAPPEDVGAKLIALGACFDRATVCSSLGEPGETVEEMTLDELAAGSFDHRSVVILLRGGGVAANPTTTWGRPESAYLHSAGMITKSEVRAIVLARFALPLTGVLWDEGAGSGSVGIEAAALAPGLSVVAFERSSQSCEHVKANALAAGVAVQVIAGTAPATFDGLTDPDRVFVGGGGIDVLDAALERLRPDGVVVATYAAMDRATQAYRRLGSMVQVAISRSEELAGGVRLRAENPVFVCWGTR